MEYQLHTEESFILKGQEKKINMNFEKYNLQGGNNDKVIKIK